MAKDDFCVAFEGALERVVGTLVFAPEALRDTLGDKGARREELRLLCLLCSLLGVPPTSLIDLLAEECFTFFGVWGGEFEGAVLDEVIGSEFGAEAPPPLRLAGDCPAIGPVD